VRPAVTRSWTRNNLLEGVDAFQLDTMVRVMADVQPDAVINCIGIMQHLRAAKDPIVSLMITSLLPHRLSDLCRASGSRLVHMSTDCVFSERKGMYTEADVPDAEDLYGRTKFLGEVDAPGCLTVRTSIVGRELETPNGLIEWFLAQKGGQSAGLPSGSFYRVYPRSFGPYPCRRAGEPSPAQRRLPDFFRQNHQVRPVEPGE
jgi:dTDP-4-dehydrorhamnose reductase